MHLAEGSWAVQIFAGLLVGAMLPYWFSAMTMKSVGKAALAMVEEVRRQFNTIPGIMEGTARPDYRLCVEISTQVLTPPPHPSPAAELLVTSESEQVYWVVAPTKESQLATAPAQYEEPQSR